MRTIIFTALSLLIFIGTASAETWKCKAFMGGRIGTLVMNYTEDQKGTVQWYPTPLVALLYAPSQSGEAVKTSTDEFTMWKFPNGDAWECKQQSSSSQWFCQYFGTGGLLPDMNLHCDAM